MLCNNPYMLQGKAFGCGQCLPCRINRRRIWSHRICLEASQYSDNCFMTLTYDDENLPEDGSLDPLALTLFLKRLRKWFNNSYGRKIRYFGVGEYGDQSNRPHYHLALFGFPNCERGRTLQRRGGRCCHYCDTVRSLWGKGRVELACLEPASASYVAGYVTKKLTRHDDERLSGRHPEFARMSNRPGIGAGVMDEVASGIMELEVEFEDVPNSLGSGRKQYPLGRYLTQQLRRRVGRDTKIPEIVAQALDAKMLPLRQAAEIDAPKGFRSFHLKTLITELNAGKRERLESRYRRSNRRGNI